eukprot:PRCOL_00001552-RA
MSNPVVPPPLPGTARAAGATAAAPPPPPPPHAVGHAIHMHVSAAAAATAPAATPQQPPKPHAANQVVSATSAAAPSIAAARAAAAAPTQSGKEVAATLAPDEWPANDYKIFCGNLDKLVGDEVLSKAFSSYPSFVKAKICRDPKTNRHKGYGFASFLNALEWVRALREVNNKYVGARPVKLSKADKREYDVGQSGRGRGRGRGGGRGGRGGGRGRGRENGGHGGDGRAPHALKPASAGVQKTGARPLMHR